MALGWGLVAGPGREWCRQELGWRGAGGVVGGLAGRHVFLLCVLGRALAADLGLVQPGWDLGGPWCPLLQAGSELPRDFPVPLCQQRGWLAAPLPTPAGYPANPGGIAGLWGCLQLGVLQEGSPRAALPRPSLGLPSAGGDGIVHYKKNSVFPLQWLGACSSHGPFHLCRAMFFLGTVPGARSPSLEGGGAAARSFGLKKCHKLRCLIASSGLGHVLP